MWVVTLDRIAKEDSCKQMSYLQQNDGVMLYFQMQLSNLNLWWSSDWLVISVNFLQQFLVQDRSTSTGISWANAACCYIKSKTSTVFLTNWWLCSVQWLGDPGSIHLVCGFQSHHAHLHQAYRSAVHEKAWRVVQRQVFMGQVSKGPTSLLPMWMARTHWRGRT